MSAPERLIYMANQIATFFASQPEGAQGVADHIRAYWDPQMRDEILAWRRTGGAGLHPLAAEAVDRLAAKAG